MSQCKKNDTFVKGGKKWNLGAFCKKKKIKKCIDSLKKACKMGVAETLYCYNCVVW